VSASKVERVALGARLALARVDAATNADRYYEMEATGSRQLDLFEEVAPMAVVVRYGRFGGTLRTKRYPCADLDALNRQWRSILATREAHGYAKPERRRRTKVPR
jgi:predicted DNA-binding WGR domain protein